MGKKREIEAVDLNEVSLTDVKIQSAAKKAAKNRGGRPKADGSPAKKRPKKNVTGPKELPAISPDDTGLSKTENKLAIETILERKCCNPLEEMVDLIQATDNEKLKLDGLKELMKYQYAQKKSVDTNIQNGINFNITLADFSSGSVDIEAVDV